MDARKTCFVVMGFGKKTDFESGQAFDLDKTYKNIIKPVVEECGLACVRADEITHSGVIDVPMYTQLLGADLVIADLSTSNANAMYELGVRHALRPHTTIVIAEARLRYPFDVNHTALRKYNHMGEDIGYDEVIRFRGILKTAIVEILARPATDSPVYTYLPQLTPPAMSELAEAAGREGSPGIADAAKPAESAADAATGTLLSQANAAFENDDFVSARALLRAVLAMRPPGAPRTANHDYLVQRLALATYKSGQPTVEAALAEAQSLLAELEPQTSNDTETLALWGAVRKRLWGHGKDRAHLDAAVRAYGRGFFLRNDYNNGINLAFLLNLRASISPPAEAIADFVEANRVRAEVVGICEQLLAPARPASSTAEAPASPVLGPETRYWVLATLAEAFVGLGDMTRADKYLAAANEMNPRPWMSKTTSDQITALQGLLASSPLQYIKVP
jgi:hypothetical protein